MKCDVCGQLGSREDLLIRWKDAMAHKGCAADIEYEAMKDEQDR